MSDPVPAAVVLHVWQVPARRVPAAMARVATDRLALRSVAGLRFARSLGTGDGRTFSPRDATPTRWALLTTWVTVAAAEAFEDSRVVRRWDRSATERARFVLTPLASRGRWARRTPFGTPTPRPHAGPVAALTRARIRPRALAPFYGAVPTVAADLRDAAGLRHAIAVGEAPVGLQGTFSVWDSADAMNRFSTGERHTDVVARTNAEGWYAEELFARFAVVRAEGLLAGKPVA